MNENKYKVLLVDDEEDNLALLYRTLRHEFSIVKTTSPVDALEILKNESVDIIISDHKMPVMDGVEFLKKSHEFQPECVRLLVTAYSDSSILIDAINYAKIDRYIKKPWEPLDLLNTIRAAVEVFKLKKENDVLIFDLKDLFSGTINAIIEAFEAKDSFTLGKSRRVTVLALTIAKHLNLSAQELGKLELAGLLYDIGMIGVSETILNKAESLTEDEYNSIKKHVEHGIKILEEIKQLKEVIKIIKYHHEKFDGTGYPYGLKGEEIPLSAKIISIADAYDSMTSNRAYRVSLSHEEAMRRIEEQSGLQFDPTVVETFKEIIPAAMAELRAFEVATEE